MMKIINPFSPAAASFDQFKIFEEEENILMNLLEN